MRERSAVVARVEGDAEVLYEHHRHNESMLWGEDFRRAMSKRSPEERDALKSCLLKKATEPGDKAGLEKRIASDMKFI
jgi:hypothetical protein